MTFAVSNVSLPPLGMASRALMAIDGYVHDDLLELSGVRLHHVKAGGKNPIGSWKRGAARGRYTRATARGARQRTPPEPAAARHPAGTLPAADRRVKRQCPVLRTRGAWRDSPSPPPSRYAIAGSGMGRSARKGFVASSAERLRRERLA